MPNGLPGDRPPRPRRAVGRRRVARAPRVGRAPGALRPRRGPRVLELPSGARLRRAGRAPRLALAPGPPRALRAPSSSPRRASRSARLRGSPTTSPIPLGSFRSNLAARAVAGSADLVSNLKRFALVQLPEPVSHGRRRGPARRRRGRRRPAAFALLALNLAAVLLAFRRPPEALRRGPHDRAGARAPRPRGRARDGVLRLLGRRPPRPARHALPLRVPALACLGLLLARLSLRSFRSPSGLRWPSRRSTSRPTRSLRRQLRRRRRPTRGSSRSSSSPHRAVLGDYWTVYPVNFLSHERVAGVPASAATDWYLRDRLSAVPPRGARLLVVGRDRPLAARRRGRRARGGAGHLCSSRPRPARPATRSRA